MRAETHQRSDWRALALGLVTMLLVGCATLPPAQPVSDIKQIVGKWEGTLKTSGGRSYPMTTTINPDGTYESIVPALSNPGPRFPGTVEVSRGGLRWTSTATGRTGTYTLHEGDGKRVLRSVADDRTSTSESTPIKP
jgi:hypothetical protein